MADVVQFKGDQVAPPESETELAELNAKLEVDRSAGLSAEGNPQRVQLMPDVETLSDAERAQVEAQMDQPAPEVSERLTIDDGQERPEWLPDKFKTPEDLARAYRELESQRGKQQVPDGKIPEPHTPADAQSAGLTDEHLLRYTSELSEGGTLSESSYGELEGMGIPKHVADAYIEGLQARTALRVNTLQQQVGGAERYAQMTSWAAENLGEAEILAFNRVIEGGDLEQAKLAVAGLQARMGGNAQRGALGQSRRVQGRPASSRALEPFASNEALVRAIQDPKYAMDPGYRKEVERRIAISGELL